MKGYGTFPKFSKKTRTSAWEACLNFQEFLFGTQFENNLAVFGYSGNFLRNFDTTAFAPVFY